ncbi:winged helix-turn-helix domain-containing protein [Sphingomonas sp. BK580]|uniref:winged helix-turn-helix domain-containing protein n=1 Tax=Sphingomonas sp. BK580 TaxID=2586972 RepID=UPI0016182877|nr:winged helix-turn-helix domain-containing protein [Sphingomonas sp. BK580]MBB3691634.1 DNA-binding winged helix-turn-helix (wHTH) protein/tetratricopeptide (TPR) repeat protein [Sphingomonas sp. BK580]
MIDLARAPDLDLAGLTIRPSLRLVALGEHEELLEPRVMQVLVALARAGGAVVSRDELVAQCWGGRIVGDDAINRVVGRLRRLGDGIGAGRFRIETIARVGYRLIVGEASAPLAPRSVTADAAGPVPEAPVRAALPIVPRRALIAGLGVAGATVVGGAWWWRSGRAPPRSPEVAALIAQARDSQRQADRQGLWQAIGLLRRAVLLAPDDADAWGQLALCCAVAARIATAADRAAFAARALAAERRAEAIDPGNAFAALARMRRAPLLGNWRAQEQVTARAARAHPDDDMIADALGRMLQMVGRMRESIAPFTRALTLGGPSPIAMYQRVVSLWSADRLEEADRAMEEAYALYPLHYAVWFTRAFLLAYTGRGAEALRMIEDSDHRPSDVDDSSFALTAGIARALATRDPRDIDATAAAYVEAAHRGSGHAENAIQFLSAAGRLDQAFAIAEGYFLRRGFAVDTLRFSRRQGTYTAPDQRVSWFLFAPPCAALRRDPRFGALAQAMGLTRYWRETGARPDDPAVVLV